ncbi:MAG: hypothetical protein GTO45_41835 [Candidatus Aminicenantes bacterium]|nr:hypothetical protein [Candidatus Aminicenantes bacterium]NIM85153.1 hypothetical protein [Candidatus Aminicenantes bacterium]NIN24663.1 hypothetical protein [Candidatus Aminicenantes bacterium]NIN48424.1 hypothetical protein [Candidatus Aminicenantes bacterium]NIN91327.1 hypothetical protein [Candidatus Aminicenantes bacterium]
MDCSNEKTWNGKGYSGFIQSDPVEGAPASEKTVVWVAYDNKAIYISARLYDSEPDKIIGLLGRRDEFVDSDWFIFSVDPYYDRRSGYQFAVNPAGSMVDWTIYNDEYSDSTWDGVWECKTRVDDKGWTVEIRIPFAQLRFKQKDHYVWGVNFRRYIKRKNERVGIVWIPKKDSGFVSHFARLVGMKDIKPGRHIEFLPYSVGKAAFGTKEEGNPFATGKDYFATGGLDLKVGLKSNLTLDLTVNPDFGQVEVDPAVINLSAAESYYSEKRPFFIEGSNIFVFGRGGTNRNIGANWGDPNFFYSRRIGRPPQGGVDTDGYVDYPDWSTILAAAKVTGKIGNGWNIGFISALTQREYAQIDLDNQRSREEVEPFSSYTVLRAQREFNEGRQGLGLISTGVLRDLRNPALKDTLNRNAFSFGVDGWTFLDKDKMWVVSGWFGATQVSGSKEAIWDLQHSYPHYFQRPDASHVSLDENATSMNGWAGRLILNKQKGNFVVNAALGAISPGFNSRDMGFQWSGDVINGHIMVAYRSFKPGKIFRNWNVHLFTQRNYDFGGHKIGEQRLIFIGSAQFLNYWSIYGQLSVNPERWSKDLTRGGPLTLLPPTTWGEFEIASDDRKPVVLSLYSYFSSSQSGSWEWSPSLGIRWKPGSNFNISLNPRYSTSHGVAQWVTAVDDEFMADTYGTRYIFAAIDQKIVSCSIRLNWIFTPKLSLQAYIQPFIAVGAYKGFKELARPRSFDFNRFGQGDSSISYSDVDELYTVDPDGPGAAPVFTFGNPDFNYKSLRGTVVLRWEYRPGSTLYAVWTQNRADYSYPGEFRLGRDLGNLFRAPGDDIFMIKFTYRLKI